MTMPAVSDRSLDRIEKYLPSTVSDGDEIRRACARAIQDVTGADDVLWTGIGSPAGTSVVLNGDRLAFDRSMSEGLSRHAFDHPAVMSYLEVGDDRAPRRLSDVTPLAAWASSAVYSEVFRESGARFQLSLVTSLGPTGGRGWVATRRLSDFTDRAVEVARGLMPLLSMLDPGPSSREAPPEGRLGLTHRESDILRHLGTGQTAQAIGRSCGISATTVRKHLEHIYRKLGANDRLTAVTSARDLGLL